MDAQIATVALSLGIDRATVARAFRRGPGRLRVVAWVLGVSEIEVARRTRPLLEGGASMEHALDFVLLRAAERAVA